MTNFLRILSLILLFTSCASIEKHNNVVTKLHPVEDLREDIVKFHKQLKRLQPRLYQFTDKETLDFKFDSLKTAMKPMTSHDFYKQLALVTKYVGQGHMTISPPSKKYKRKERAELWNLKYDINKLDTEYLDNKLFISNAIREDSLLKHAEILKVNDEKPQDLIKIYKTIIASDGYNTTLPNRAVGNRFFKYYYTDKGHFDSIVLTLRNTDSIFIKEYKHVAKLKVNYDSIIAKRDSIDTALKLTKADKKAKKLKRKKKRKEEQKKGYDFFSDKNDRELSFVGEDRAVAFMKIRGFTGGKYKLFYEDAFAILDSIKTKTLVIDLRDNFGGNLFEISNLYSYLTDENFTFTNKSEINTRFPILKGAMSKPNSLRTKIFAGLLSPGLVVVNLLRVSKKDGQLYYKLKLAKEQEPNPLNFKGKVYVLINGNSFSASAILSTQLKGSKRATFVGEETGGAYNGTVAGIAKVYELPNTKVRARIGLMHIDTKFKIEPDGFGVKPDVEIFPSYQNRLNDVDPELEWVLKDVEKSI